MKYLVKDILELFKFNNLFNSLSLDEKLDIINRAYLDLYNITHKKEEFIFWNRFVNKNNELVDEYELDLLEEKHQVIDYLSEYKIKDLELDKYLIDYSSNALTLLFRLAAINIIREYFNSFIFETIIRQLYFEYSKQLEYYKHSFKSKFNKIDNNDTLTLSRNLRLIAPTLLNLPVNYTLSSYNRNITNVVDSIMSYQYNTSLKGAINLIDFDYVCEYSSKERISDISNSNSITYTISWEI